MMVEKIGRAAMLELLAEESAELSQAALKMARIMRGENPTPVTRMQAEKNLIEEYTDVRLCAIWGLERTRPRREQSSRDSSGDGTKRRNLWMESE